MLPLVALGIAACDADHKVREVGGNNRGPRIRQYLANVGFAEGAPWCAAAIAYWSDLAARSLGVQNPLDAVKLEALVQSYYDRLQGSEVPPDQVQPGDLVLYKFGSSGRWDHIGIVSQPPLPGAKGFTAVEGNTSEESQRDGDAVAFKPRLLDAGYPVCFIAWDGRDLE
jgi:hypothetical protein